MEAPGKAGTWLHDFPGGFAIRLTRHNENKTQIWYFPQSYVSFFGGDCIQIEDVSR